MNPWLVLAMLSPVLMLLALYSIVVIVALLRADVKDVPSVLDVGVTVYGQLATRAGKLFEGVEGRRVNRNSASSDDPDGRVE